MLDHGADPNVKAYDGSTVLTVAVRAGNSGEVIRALISHGADVNPDKNNQGETPLSAAVTVAGYGWDAGTVRLLLENGANASTTYQDQEFTILHLYYLTIYESSSSPEGAGPDPGISWIAA